MVAGIYSFVYYKTKTIVDDAIRKGVKYIWMQDGVVDAIAATRARTAGILVVMDNCILREHKRRNQDYDA